MKLLSLCSSYSSCHIRMILPVFVFFGLSSILQLGLLPLSQKPKTLVPLWSLPSPHGIYALSLGSCLSSFSHSSFLRFSFFPQGCFFPGCPVVEQFSRRQHRRVSWNLRLPNAVRDEAGSLSTASLHSSNQGMRRDVSHFALVVLGFLGNIGWAMECKVKTPASLPQERPTHER